MITRRQFNALVGSSAAALGLGITPGLAQQAEAIRWGTFTPGFLPALTHITKAQALDEANGILLGDPTAYSSLTSYYGEFVAGAFDVCFGSWDSFALRKAAGVDLKFLCMVNPGELLNLVTLSPDATSLEDFRGKTLAAPTSTGTFRMMKALIKEFYDFDIETDMQVQSVDHPVGAVTLLLADRADLALTWEPSVTIAQQRNPDTRVLINMGQVYRERMNDNMPYFGVAVRQAALDAHDGLGTKLSNTFRDAVNLLNSQPEQTYEAAESDTGLEPSTLQAAHASGRLVFRHASMTDAAERQAVIDASEILVRQGVLEAPVGEDFFYTA